MRVRPLVFALLSSAMPCIALADEPTSAPAPAPAPTSVEPGTVQSDVAPPTSNDLTSGESVTAEPATETPVVRRRVVRDRFSNTISLGATLGLGSPFGIAGAYLEYRPIKWASLQAGGGFGGSFGPAVGGALYVDPVVTRYWSLGVAGALSHNFSYVSGELVPGRQSLPTGTNWGSVELQTQVRPTRGMFLRLGFGRSFLFDTQAFRVATESELDTVGLPTLPLPSPLDAVRAAARDESFGVWYFHIDIATAWRL